jgi:hypothetical protein
MKKTPFSALFLAALLLLCSACATAPIACPSPRVPPAPVPLGPSFQDEMGSFLKGSLPEPTASAPSSTPARSEKP